MVRLRTRRRDRVDAVTAPSTPATHHYNYVHQPNPASAAPRDGKTLVRFGWTGGAARNISLVASFDGFMHHRMHRIALGQRNGPATFEVSLRIAPGTYTYKFLVDGTWRTDPQSPHRIETSPDGVLNHRLVVEKSIENSTSASSATNGNGYPGHLRSALDLASNGVSRPSPRYTPVVRSSSVSDLHNASTGHHSQSARHYLSPTEAASQQSFTSLNSDTAALTRGGGLGGHMSSLSGSAMLNRGHSDRNDRPSSFMAVPGGSPAGSAHRKSLLPRFGSGWMRRFSGRHHSNVSEVQLDYGNSEDKENGGNVTGNNVRIRAGTPERSKLRGIRASGRATAVTVSGPTSVDEPSSAAEVNRDADVWRQMARELAENLHDPHGARELLFKAVRHREKHGLWCTVENAQTHVDLARNLSKADRLPDAEFHLRIALRIYKRIDSGPEHIGDLLHYIGVVVDRQKKRGDAEQLYRAALDTYRANRLTGNNVDIALKNLSLNLRKQGREAEAQIFVRDYTSGTGFATKA